jgi:hypothetical protein
MFVEPHFGQNFLLPKTLSCFLALSTDLLKAHFCFHRLPSSLNLNSLACSPHNGQCCPGSSCLSYVHLVFGQVHQDMLTHHQKLDQSWTRVYYRPRLITLLFIMTACLARAKLAVVVFQAQLEGSLFGCF